MPGFTSQRFVEIEQERRELLYLAHKRQLRARGIDPDWIGSHEVEQPCCKGCGAKIPWAVLKGWID